MSIISFVQSRVARGAMHEVAVSRINTLVRTLDRGLHFKLCAITTPPPPTSGRLHVREIELRDANAFVNTRHRHLAGVVGHKFSIGVFTGSRLVGVAIIGRPLARFLDNGNTLEILRVATDGTRNACSKLLGAARRGARDRCAARIITYTLPSEPGTSLRAAGFACEGPAGGGAWARRGRGRADRHPTVRKLRWSSAA